jgi:hypothetical protein
LTKEILLGTNKGIILELTIEYDSSTDTIKHTCTKLFEIDSPIYGIEYIVFSGLPCKISIIVASTNKLFQFLGDPNDQGRPGFLEIFNKYRGNTMKVQRSSIECSGNKPISQLQVYYSQYFPDSFC